MDNRIIISCPVRLLDGSFGIIIRQISEKKLVGVQVPGEEDIRWIGTHMLQDWGGGAFVELSEPPKDNHETPTP